MKERQYCPNCGSKRYKPNPDAFGDGKKLICTDCGHKFDEPSYNKITWPFWQKGNA